MRVLGLALLVGLWACSSDSNNDAGPMEGGGENPIVDMVVDAPPPPDPVITAMTPSSGPACPKANEADSSCTGFTTVTISGSNFIPGQTTVFVNGGAQDGYIITDANVLPKSVTFNLRKNPTDPVNPNRSDKVSVQVIVDQRGSEIQFFQYWTTADATSDFQGSITTGNLSGFSQFPSEMPALGRVKLTGQTATTTGAVPIGMLWGQVGVGPVGETPADNPRWTWSDAEFSADDGEFDTYTANVLASLNGSFDMAYRFSSDFGKTWIFVDSNGATMSYSAADAAKFTATAAPPFYCQIEDHCTTFLLRVRCETGINRCVECLENADCTNNVNSVGSKCNPSNQCFCDSNADCPQADAPTCITQGAYCGCEGQQDECPTGKVCLQQNWGHREMITRCGDPPPDAGI